MNNKSIFNRSNIQITILSIFIAIYIWRLHFLGEFINIFLFIGLIEGIKKNGRYFKYSGFFGNKFFYFIIIGILVSFFLAAFIRGSILEQLRLNGDHTTLKLWRIFEGVMLFLLIVLNIDNKYKLIKFLNILLYINIFFALLMIFQISDNFVSLLGIKTYNISEFTVTLGVDITRHSFATLDEASFGGIMTVFAVYSLFKYLFQDRRHVKYLIFTIIFFIAVVMTVSRTAIIKLVISLLIYLYYCYRINLRVIFISIIVTITILIIASKTNTGQNIYIRFEEIFFNLQDLANEKELISRDSFQYRIVRSLIGVPNNLYGWVFGSGGIQTARIGDSSDHIEYTNWLWQYGLITFTPFIMYFINLLYTLSKYNKKINDKLTKHLTAFGVSIIVGLLISMVSTPQFYFLWIWLAFSVVIINISRKMHQIKKQKESKNLFIEK